VAVPYGAGRVSVREMKDWTVFGHQFHVQGKEVAILFDHRFFLPELPIISSVAAFLAGVRFFLLKTKDELCE